MPDNKKENKDEVNPEGQQDRKGNYDIDGVSYKNEETYVGGDATTTDSAEDKKSKANK